MGALAQVQGPRGHRRGDNSEGVTLRDGSHQAFEIRGRRAVRHQARRDRGPAEKGTSAGDRQAEAADAIDRRDHDPLHRWHDAYYGPEAVAQRELERRAYASYKADCDEERRERRAFKQVDFDLLFVRSLDYGHTVRELLEFPEWFNGARKQYQGYLANHLHALFVTADGHFGPELAADATEQLSYFPAWETVAALAWDGL